MNQVDLSTSPLMQPWIEFSKDHGPLFESLIALNQAKVIIEIGAAFGSTTKYLCAGAAKTGGIVQVYDVWGRHGLRNQWGAFSSKESVQEYLISEGFNNFVLTQINTRAPEFKTLIDALPLIDFAFIDGCHSYEGVKSDFDIIYPRLSQTGIVALHDTLKIDGCRELVIDLRTTLADGTYDVVDFPFGNRHRRVGISLLVKRTFPVLGIKCDEIANLEDRLDAIYQKEQDWYRREISQE